MKYLIIFLIIFQPFQLVYSQDSPELFLDFGIVKKIMLIPQGGSISIALINSYRAQLELRLESNNAIQLIDLYKSNQKADYNEVVSFNSVMSKNNKKYKNSYFIDSGKFTLNIQFDNNKSNTYCKISVTSLSENFLSEEMLSFQKWLGNSKLDLIFGLNNVIDLNETPRSKFSLKTLDKISMSIAKHSNIRPTTALILNYNENLGYMRSSDDYYTSNLIWQALLNRLSVVLKKPLSDLFIYLPIDCNSPAIFYDNDKISFLPYEECNYAIGLPTLHDFEMIDSVDNIKLGLSPCNDVFLDSIIEKKSFKLQQLIIDFKEFLQNFYSTKRGEMEVIEFKPSILTVSIRKLKGEILHDGSDFEKIDISCILSFDGNLPIYVVGFTAAGFNYPPDSKFETLIEEGSCHKYCQILSEKFTEFLNKKYLK